MVEDGYRSNIDCNIQQPKRNIIQWYPVKKIVATYTLVETPSTDGSAIVGCTDPTRHFHWFTN
ncbi:MAG: hypothetical protein ACLS5G_00105 [Streptococcus sp.]